MGIQRRDGSIQSANTPAHNTMAKTRIEVDYGIYRCMIMATHFTDDVQGDNLTFANVQVSYEAMILGGPLEGQILQNVKSAGDYGGENNYSEKIWKPNDVTPITDKNVDDLTGDIVFVGFLQGSVRAPVILGGGIQPNDITNTGATTAEGYRSIKQYNGVFESINNQGEFLLQRKGGALDSTSGFFTPADSSWEAQLQFSMDKIFLGDTNSNITFNKSAKTMTTTVGSVTETIDGANNKITQTVGGATVTIDGNSNQMTITIGGTTLLVDGNSNTISLEAGFVNLGKSVSDFATLFTMLAASYNSHTHIWPGGITPAPTSPPLAPLLTSVGSQTVQVQS